MGAEFRSIYRHGLARVAACTTQLTLADPAANAAAILELARRRPRRGAAWRCSRNSASRATQSTTCCIRTRCWTRSRAAIADIVAAAADLLPVLLVGAPLRHARRALQQRGGDPPRPGARRRAQDLPAQLPRVLREAALRHAAPAGGRRASPSARNGAVRHRPAVRRRRHAATSLPRRDLRGHLGADPARGYAALAGAKVLANLSASNITIGKAETRRLLCRVAVGALPRRLPLHRRRRRRIHHRPRLGRPGLDLRERRHAGRDRAVPVGQPVRRSPISTSTCCARADADGQLRRQPPAPRHAHSAASASAWTRRRANRLASAGSSAFPSCRPTRHGSSRIATRPTTSRSRPGAAPARHRLKRVVIGVSGGLDSTHALIVCARALDLLGLPRAQDPGLHHAGLRHLGATPRPTPAR